VKQVRRTRPLPLWTAVGPVLIFLFVPPALAQAQTSDSTPALRTRSAAREDSAAEADQSVPLQVSMQMALLERLGHTEQGVAAAKSAIRVIGALFGENHPYTAFPMASLGHTYRVQGKYDLALPVLLRAVEINREYPAEQVAYGSRILAFSLDELGGLYADTGRYAEAEPLLRETFEIRRKLISSEHREYRVSLKDLASLYRQMAEYPKSEKLFLQVTDIEKRALGEDNPDYAIGLGELASLYREMAEYSKAEQLYLQAIEIRTQVFGENDLVRATCVNNLALLYDIVGEREKTVSLYQQNNVIVRQLLGEDHRDYATCLCNLGDVYRRMNEYSKAEMLIRSALDIERRVLGEAHPNYARDINNLARLYQDMGEYDRAEPLMLQALDIRKQVFGRNHPDYVIGLSHLTDLCRQMQQEQRAASICEQLLESELNLVDEVLPSLSEAAAMAFLTNHSPSLADYLSIQQTLRAAKTEDIYRTVWKTRALLTRMLSQRRQLLLESPDAVTVQQDLQQTQTQLAQLTLAQVAPEDAEGRIDQLAGLNTRKESLERQLAAMSEPFRRSLQVREADVADLAALMPPHSALVDVVRERNWTPSTEKPGEWESQWQYQAFVIRPAENDAGFTVRWIHLGDAESIDGFVETWLDKIRGRKTDLPDSSADRLRQILWDPIEQHLTGCTTLFLVPDGALHRMPWVALPGRQPGSVLLEDYFLATVGNGQQLYELLSHPAELNQRLLLVGSVNYDSRDSAAEQPAALIAAVESSARSGSRSAAQSQRERLVWPALPGTSAELDELQQLWADPPSADVLTGPKASEHNLRRLMPKARCVHLATHGFFADETFRSMFRMSDDGERLLQKTSRSLVTAGRATVTARNPLILSGLVVAGANLQPAVDELDLPTGDDGIMTAEEVVNLDLLGTELVVLSACETGLGKTAGGEGVLGLQRAFHLAGARNVVASLWKVDDRATAALMKLLYHKLWVEKKPVLGALREAQLSIYHHPEQISELAETRGPRFDKVVQLVDGGRTATQRKRTPIHLWAAFTLSGPGS